MARVCLAKVQEHESLNNAKVLAVTASPLYEDIEKACEPDLDWFIGNPLSTDGFAGQVQQVLDGQSVRAGR